MESVSTIIVLVLLSIFSVFGTIGNSLVLYIYSCKKEKSTAGIFIMSLAGTDLFTCLVIVPFTEATIYLQYRLEYDIVCKAYMFLITCNIPLSAFIMVAIAVDRYFCICHPFLHALNIKRAKLIVMCLLMVVSVFGIITALSHGVPAEPSFLSTAGLDDNPVSTNISSYVQDVREGNFSFTSDGEVYRKNDSAVASTNSSTQLNASLEMYLSTRGMCIPSNKFISPEFAAVYHKAYAGCYLLSFTAVLILYGLIYRSIHHHRAKRNKRKRSSLYPVGVEFSMVETQFTAVTHVNPHGKKTGDANDGSNEETQAMQGKPRKFHKPMSIKEKTLLANIRTAAMLFVVTVVFLVAFLPAWLMAHRLLEFNEVVFYMYFAYNMANPFIYAFMNKSFRDDLGKVIKCQSVPLVR